MVFYDLKKRKNVRLNVIYGYVHPPTLQVYNYTKHCTQLDADVDRLLVNTKLRTSGL